MATDFRKENSSFVSFKRERKKEIENILLISIVSLYDFVKCGKHLIQKWTAHG